MQNVFGAGVLFGTPTTDAYGNALSNPTPIQFGVAQEASVDISFDTKQLYGQNQFPVAIGRGKGKASGKFNLGVKNANGVPMTKVASAPATGQYSVAAGVYTFAAADTGLVMFINYQYTSTSTTAKKSAVLSLPMGYAPTFRADIYLPYHGKSLIFTFPNCVSSKLSLATKLDDFMVPEIDFEIFADSSNNLGTYALSE